MSADQFLDSARVSSAPLTDPELTVGPAYPRGCARDPTGGRDQHQSRHHPALRAAGPRGRNDRDGNLRGNLGRRFSTVDDDGRRGGSVRGDRAGFARRARLGRCPRCQGRADGPLLEAMREAAGRDMIARQYVTGYRGCLRSRLAAHRARRSPAASAACGRPSSPTWRFSPPSRTAMWRASTARKSQRRCRHEAQAVRASLDATASEAARIALADGIRPAA